MLDSILLTPDNRFLSLSMQDFGLYGGQTPWHLQVGRAAASIPFKDAADSDSARTGSMAEVDPLSALLGGASGPSTEALDTHVVPTPSSGLSQTIKPIAPAPSMAEPLGAPPITSSLAPFVPAFVTTSLPIGNGDPGAGASTLAADTKLATLSLDTVEPLAPSMLNAPQLVGDAVDGLTTLVGTITSTLSEKTEAVDSVATLVGATAHAATNIVSDATEAAGSLIDDATTGFTAPIAATVGPLADAAMSFVEDDLAGLPGTDPLGGVATLVSLVSADDVFDVAESSPDSFINTPAPDLLSTLASDAPPESPLLGDHDDGDGALAGLTHDDPLGII
jgi:hypothetical protein